MSEPAIPLGRVAAPPEHESTSGKFYCWVDRDRGIERTQIVATRCEIGGRTVKFVGVVQEVYRRSRQRDIGEESARFDGRTSERPPFPSEGVTYAEVAILRTDPIAHTPPTEESEVYLATAEEAASGYGVDKMGERLDVGLLRNGGTQFAGTAAIDLDFLLGKNGGHLNVNGIAGLGTKSTLLLTVIWLLLREQERQRKAAPSGEGRLQVVPVIFNVKNFDLFHIDRWNRTFRKDEAEHRADWQAMCVSDPRPFTGVKFFAPQVKNGAVPVPTGSRGVPEVKPYSWTLADIVKHRLFRFLFSDDDLFDANFGGLVGDVEEWLTFDSPAGPTLGKDAPQTFDALLKWFQDHKKEKEGRFSDYTSGTRGKFFRRLKFIVQEGDGVLRRHDVGAGNPLEIPSVGQTGPIVVDLYGLTRTPTLQRFVVAAVFHQIAQHQTAKQVENLKYLIAVDELNRFAPRNSTDPITELIATVAAEGRSQGIILLGAQQQASLVSTRVIENAAVRPVGRSGALELGQDVWKFLGKSAKDAAMQLQPDEKLLYLPSFREPMLAKIPYPPFALSQGDAVVELPAKPVGRGTADVDPF